MRIEIKTKGRIKCNDIRALYLLHEAMKISTPRMREANLRFIQDQLYHGEYIDAARGKEKK